MFSVETTSGFDDWLRGLRDQQARIRILSRVSRIRDRGLFGDVRPVGGPVRELRIDHGPGYRVYFVQRDKTLVLLLCGGDKNTQKRDIETAKALAEGLEQ